MHPRRPRAFLRLPLAPALLTVALLTVPAGNGGAVPALSSSSAVAQRTYRNPLAPEVPGDGTVDSCADPTVLRGQRAGDPNWYMYCTTDPLNDDDLDAQGNLRFHPVPQLRSRDLVHWTYLGDAVPELPAYAAEGARLWAPEVVYSEATDRYYMLFVVTETDDSLSEPSACQPKPEDPPDDRLKGDSAIGIAVSDSPTGPWTVSDEPVVGPRPNPEDPCTFFANFDPDVLGDTVAASSTLYFGSYFGGVHATEISFTGDGATTSGTTTPVAIPNRYEGTNVVKARGWYWLFASATNCCAGPLTSYGVFAGRSRSPLGPFVDRDGNSLLQGRVGGTPVLLPNHNRWLGTGHNSVFRDAAGRWWTIYHAVDRRDPYFATDPGFTKRPAMLDPLDWVDGWPTVRAGRGASARPMPAPAVRADRPSAYRPRPMAPVRLGRMLPRFSDDFSDGLGAAWRWTGTPPAASTYAVENGELRWDTQPGDIARDSNNAAILTHQAPRRGDFAVQTRVRLDLPPEGCCHNFVQAGLVLHDGPDRFIKLVHVSIFETRQTEFAKEVPSAPPEFPVYGNGVVGPPGDLTVLRVVVDRRPGADRYTAYTRQAGGQWVRGGTWTHGIAAPRIGLVSMGDAAEEGFTARFLDVRTWRLAR